jgi:hypothetical protein
MCSDCDEATTRGDAYPFRWHSANIIVSGCHKHVSEIHAVLREALSENHTVKIYPDGTWTIQHPFACRPDLHACRFNQIVEDSPDLVVGTYQVYPDGTFAFLTP